MKHTKDPWYITKNNKHLMTKTGLAIATITGKNKKNTQLILAAPEMIKALLEVRQVIMQQNDGNCLASVLDAIDKAIGDV